MNVPTRTARLEEIREHLARMHRQTAAGEIEDAAASYARAEASLAAIRDAADPNASDCSTGRTADRAAAPSDAPIAETEAEVLGKALDELQDDAREVFADASLTEGSAARLAAALRARSYLLRRASRHAHRRPSLDELPFLFREIEDIGTRLHHDAPAVERLAEVRAEAAWVRAAHLYGQARGIENPAATPREIEASFRIARALRRARRDLETVDAYLGSDTPKDAPAESHAPPVSVPLPHPSAVRELREGLADEFERLFAGSLEGIAQCDSIESRTVAIRIASLMTSELDELRVLTLDTSKPTRAAETPERLSEGRRVLDAIVRARRKLLRTDTEPTGMRRAARRLARMIRRLEDVRSDRILRARLERIFKRGVVRIWESIVFWLIVSVLGLLVIEHYFPPPPDRAMPWTLWVDTAICFVLLLDFTTRWILTPRRARYFARHFLTELLPALPFGLLAALSTDPALRSVRVLRLIRVFRVLRLLQPLIRFTRLLLFVLRASDRLVERNAWLLNHDILFFHSGSTPSDDEPPLVERMRDLDRYVTNTTAERFDRLSAPDSATAASWRARFVTASLAHCESHRPAEHDVRRAGTPNDVHVEEVIALLRTLDDTQVAERLGPDVARQISSSLRLFRLPMLRRLPVVRFVIGPAGAPDPLWITARLGHVFADVLDALYRAITWFTDLYGTITGSQFLDRMGLHLVRAFERPTKRLVMFAFALAFVYGLVHLFRLEFLSAAITTIVVFLSGPVWLLGILCLIPLVLGLWFRRIAGQAVDFFDQVAEAQLLSLTEIAKEDWARTRLPYLAERVILPEAKLVGDVTDVDRERLLEQACARIGAASHTEEPVGSDDSPAENDPIDACFDWHRCDFVVLFFRNFVDGAWFHRNDTKIANLLLGNLTLANVRENRLRITKAEQRRVEKLDIDRGKGGIFGPAPWFNFITHAIAQRTARLVIEYNQHCIPLDELPTAHAEDKELYESWLDMREAISRHRAAGRVATGQGEIGGAGGTLQYRTTEFHVLHFLSADRARDDDVRNRFGDRVLGLLREDRESLIRETFGTFPIHELPKERRMLNPYEFYMRHVARGRVFLAPFFLARVGLRFTWIALRRLVAIVQDVLDPESRPATLGDARADFTVARRKLHRMRRPIVFEAVRLRAAFDPEYLGLEREGLLQPLAPGQRVADDLRRLGAAEREWEEFRLLESQRDRRLDMLVKLLDRQRLGGSALAAEIRRRNPVFAGRERECTRALVLAFACDLDDVATLIETRERFRDWIDYLASDDARREARARPTRRRRRRVARVVGPIWTELAQSHAADEHLRDAFVDAVASAPRDELARLEGLREALGDPPRDLDTSVLELLFEQALQPSVWTEQIVAVRMVQSLGMIDLAGYEHAIAVLGGFEDDLDPGGGSTPREQRDAGRASISASGRFTSDS